uniref:Phosphodiesterase 1B n=1 Tax=Terrapene triunguis TaxID=2587831 RepID=A0A674I9B3_9SAUR
SELRLRRPPQLDRDLLESPEGCPSPLELKSAPSKKMWVKLRALLRYMVKQLENGEVNIVELKKNLEYTASLLEAVYIDETRQILDTEDELQEIKSDAVPSEVRDWLASTFTQQTRAKGRRSEEKPKFRSIVHAVQAGIFVERMFRRTYTAVGPNYSTSVINCLKTLDLWCFDVFALNRVTEDHALRTIVFELLTRHNLNSRFKVSSLPPSPPHPPRASCSLPCPITSPLPPHAPSAASCPLSPRGLEDPMGSGTGAHE